MMLYVISGCRNALVNVEARPLDATSFTRRCLVAKLLEFSAEKYKELVSQNAGGVLILLPDNLTSLTPGEKEVRLGVRFTADHWQVYGIGLCVCVCVCVYVCFFVF